MPASSVRGARGDLKLHNSRVIPHVLRLVSPFCLWLGTEKGIFLSLVTIPRPPRKCFLPILIST